MRKIFLIFCLFSISFVAYTQQIIYDQFHSSEEEKVRIIHTSLVPVRSITDRIVFSTGLNAIQYQNNTKRTIYSFVLGITTTDKVSILEDSKLLIKLSDDSILELNTFSEYRNSEWEDLLYQLRVQYPVYSISAFYFVTENEIEKINRGVKKIRVETSIGFLDKEYKKDKIGKAIETGYKAINRALANNNDIYIRDFSKISNPYKIIKVPSRGFYYLNH